MQNQAGWDWQREQSQVWRDGFPDDLQWVDEATDKDLARLVTFFNSYRTPQTEIFNRRITRTYVTPGQTPGGAPVTGFKCDWVIGPDGTLSFGPACDPPPTAFFLNDDISQPTFYRQRVVAEKPGIGRVVEVEGAPRLKAVINPPCLTPFPTQNLTTGEINPPQATCATGTQGVLYLDDEPGKVVLRFQGGPNDQVVQVQGNWEQTPRLVNLPAGKPTAITLNAPKGTSQWSVAFDWQGAPPAVPELTSATLTVGDETTELLF